MEIFKEITFIKSGRSDTSKNSVIRLTKSFTVLVVRKLATLDKFFGKFLFVDEERLPIFSLSMVEWFI